MTGERVFITGGAAGLGRALAQKLTAGGARVCIGDIDPVAGQATAVEIGADFIACDVRRSEDLAAAVARMRANWGGADLVINNAGVAQMGPLSATSAEDWQWIVDINLMGVVRTTQAFLPVFTAQGAGRFLNIASMSAMLHLPNTAAYGATKAAVLALSETMMIELEGAGIRTHVACPSFFRTALARNMRASDPKAGALTTRLVERSRLGADEIALRILDGLARGETHILPHPKTRRAWRMKRWLPFGRYLAGLRKQVAGLDARLAQAPKELP